ncbi:MAG: hypothetical protein GSR84_02660, partial [Desulfurococcales archaeon]|nr:hypothetical protein [Desulfurococcales archaeon]
MDRPSAPHHLFPTYLHFSVINLSRLGGLEEGWGSPYILSHDFNLQGLEGWRARLGSYELSPVPGYLEVEYLTPVHHVHIDGQYSAGAALLLHANKSTVMLVRALDTPPSSMEGVRAASYALASRPDCRGEVTVHAGLYYVGRGLGAVSSTGGLTYDSILPYIIGNGSNWILSGPTGLLEIYSPTGDLVVRSVEAYKAPPGTYLVGGEPYRAVGEAVGVVARQENGGAQSYPAGELDGLPVAVVPGNPLIVSPVKPVRGALLLDLAPGFSRLPGLLEMYRLEDGSWVRVGAARVVPASGRIGFHVDAGPGSVFMLKSTVTVRIDRLFFSQVERVDPSSLGAIGNVSVAEIPGGVRASYDPGGYDGPVLFRVEAWVGGGPVLY